MTFSPPYRSSSFRFFPWKERTTTVIYILLYSTPSIEFTSPIKRISINATHVLNASLFEHTIHLITIYITLGRIICLVKQIR
jgi:hypothetical protein